MRSLPAVLLVLCSLLSPTARGAAQGEAPAGRLTERVVAASHPDQAYALYLPSLRDPARPPPALIVLDPRGRALEALRPFVPGAAARGWIVLSAYGSRSDVPQAATLAALQALLDDLDARYPHDRRRLYLAGMSGTAKTLWTVWPSLRGRIAGLIGVCGGRPPELGRLDDATPAFVGMTGDLDFNYREMVALDADLDATQAPHRLQRFAGGHGWPADPAQFGAAIDWLDAQAMREGLAPHDEALIASRWTAAEAEIAAAPDALEQLRLVQAAIREFAAWRDVSALTAQAARLAASPEVGRLQRLDASLHARERRFADRYEAWSARLRTPYIEGLASNVPALSQSLFELRIAALQRQMRDPVPRVAASAARQLELAYVGASFYLPTLLLARGEATRAIAAYRLAQAVFPDRARAYLGQARVHVAQHDADAAFAMLQAARGHGALDRDGLLADPDLQALHSDPRWPELLNPPAAAAAVPPSS